MRMRLIVIVGVAFAVGALAAIGLFQTKRPNVTYTGKALIGGPFTLKNQKGQTVTDKDFGGQYMLVSFGYTYCPDICPAELQVISNAMEKLGDKAEKVTPLFITIDPERDTVSQLAGYMQSFHPRMIGLTGTKEQIKQAASAYRVYYTRAEGGGSNEDYLMDHSTFIYLMDPKGEYLTHFPYGISAADLADRISAEMNKPAA